MAVNQGSRAGLMTALVIFVILFFVAAIFAVIKGVDQAETATRLQTLRDKYTKVISDSELAGDDLRVIDAIRSTPENRNRSAWHVLLQERNDLIRKLTGRDPDPNEPAAAAIAAVDKAINDANAKTAVSAPLTSVTAALDTYATAIVENLQQLAQKEAQLKQAGDGLAQQAALYQQEYRQYAADVEKASTTATGAQEESRQYRQSIDQQVARLQSDIDQRIREGRDIAEELRTQIAAANQESAQLQEDVAKLREALKNYRPQNVGDSLIRQADGKIIRVERDNVVYVNLGAGQQLTPGMTFEIYDKDQGIPKIDPQDPDQLPKGKGSLEIVRVGAGSSEGRVISLAHGARLYEGDLIANLVFNPEVRYAFMVHGKFDTDQNGVATDNEREIIRRLITQWGGRVVDDISVSTDFVVLGREPVIPPISDANDPIERDREARAREELNQYNQVIDRAQALHIPILNQNRFLHLIGYFEQGRRY